MLKYLKLLISFSLCTQVAFAQKEGYIWVYGDQKGIDFNTQPAAEFNSSIFSHHYRGGSAAICDKDGNLLFYTNGVRVWDQSHGTMSGGILFNTPTPPVNTVPHPKYEIRNLFQAAAIAPDPTDKNRFYIFHSIRNFPDVADLRSDTCSLFYSVVDMRLNNGLGAVVNAEKNVLIDSLVSSGMTITKGPVDCSVWILVQGLGGTMKSYKLSAAGMDPTPVLSNLNPLPDSTPYTGILKVSPDGKRLGLFNCYRSITPNGLAHISVFDFDRATGEVSNDLVLMNSPGLDYVTLGSGLAFSPNSSKLYICYLRRVYQYNLSLGTNAAILSSMTMVSGDALLTGDLKTGPDGRMYVAKAYSGFMWNMPGYAGASSGLLYFQNPDGTGLNSQFQYNDMLFRDFSHFYFGAFPNDIVVLPRDTAGSRQDVLTCGTDSTVISLRSPATNITWNDGSTDTKKTVTESGIYTVQYQHACHERFDTFIVHFQELPELLSDRMACMGMRTGRAVAVAADSTAVQYHWGNSAGILRNHTSTHGDTLYGLGPGDYYVRVITPSGCDTTIDFSIDAWPQEDLLTEPQYALVKYGDTIQLNAYNYLLYTWSPSGSLDSATRPDPVARPFQPVTYTVIGLDENGCRDTGFVRIEIDYSMPDLVPNAFSPNGDGLNDVFKVAGVTYQRLLEFRIFNRWGQEVFFTDQTDQGWDGTFKGIPCNMDTYFYLVRLAYPDGKTKTLKGEVHLLR